MFARSKWVERGPNLGQPKFWWSVVDSASMEESSAPRGSEGWSFAGGLVDTPKAGSDKAGPVMAETSGEAMKG